MKNGILKFVPVLLIPFVACTSNTSKNDNLEVYVDHEFTKMYMPDSGGVTAADGTISIVLDDGSSLFLTGDCFFGDVVDNKRDPGDPMLNNALIHISKDGKYIASYHGGTKEEPATLCTPLEAAEYERPFWYWPGDGFQQGNILHLYMTKFYQEGEGQWGFRFMGTDHVSIDMSDYSVISQEEIYDRDCPIHWGHSVMVDGDYIYVYGTRSGSIYDPATLCVSRARFADAAGKLSYEYFDGEGWNTDPASAADCKGTDKSVSEQFSVFPHGDKYVLLTQRRLAQSGEIYSYIADAPTGPWYNEKLLYTTTEQDGSETLFTYNAMAHPQFTNKKNELLICYNINSYDVEEIFRDVQTYRPVFLRVPMKLILD